MNALPSLQYKDFREGLCKKQTAKAARKQHVSETEKRRGTRQKNSSQNGEVSPALQCSAAASRGTLCPVLFFCSLQAEKLLDKRPAETPRKLKDQDRTDADP